MSLAFRLVAPLFVLLLSAPAQSSWAQGNRCASEAILDASLASDTAYARSFFAVQTAMRSMASTGYRTTTEYTLPVVVHILHHGEAVGMGNNLSDVRVQEAIDALNADFRGEYGGVDIDIEFELASRDPEGNPSTGIVRIDAASAVPEYVEEGMVTDENLHPSSETNLKTLSHWPKEDYINVWVVSGLNGGMSPLGFAYLPPVTGFYDGIVLHQRVFGIGEEYDLLNNYDLNKSLTHEIGHYLGLFHTFRFTSQCGEETNCNAQGDQVCDTPATTGSAGCSALDCPETMVNNYMDYAYDQCVNAFTEGQRTRMRNALLNYRESLLTSEALIPVVAQDAGVASIQGLAPVGCNATHDIEVSLQNFGTQPITSAAIHFALDEGDALTVMWEGQLEAGMSIPVTIPSIAAGEGAHSLSVWTEMETDEYAPNDTLQMDFEVVPGTMLTMDIQFDFLPHGITWMVENTDLDMVVMEGGDYINDVYASEFISLDGCASDGCYTLTVEDLFGNGMHYSPPGWYELTDTEGNVLGTGTGNFGSEQTHEFCVEGSSVEPCEDLNGNGVCDEDEDELFVEVTGCTDPASCTYDAVANADDGTCEYLDALGDCGGDCDADVDGDGICDSEEIPGCTDEVACNYDSEASEDDGGCEYADAGLDCEGNPLVVILGCMDDVACNYDEAANTDDGGCEYADEGLDCEGNPLVVILGCMDDVACNYDEAANTDDGGCEYAAEGFDCDGNPLTSNVSDLESTPGITVFPNPSSGRIAFRGLQNQGPHELTVHDLNGRLLLQERALASPDMNGWTVRPETPLLPGAYLIRIRDGATATEQTLRVLVH